MQIYHYLHCTLSMKSYVLNEELIKCVKESLHTEICCKKMAVLTSVLNCNGQQRCYDEKSQVCLGILSFIGSRLVTSSPVFGLFRCLWVVLSSYVSQTPPEFIGSGLRPLWKGCSRSACWCAPRFRWQSPCIQRNHSNRATTLEFALIEPNTPSVNTQP